MTTKPATIEDKMFKMESETLFYALLCCYIILGMLNGKL